MSNQFATPSDVFSRVNSEFQSNPSKAAGTNAVYQFDLSGDNGGQYHIIVKEGQGEAGQGRECLPRSDLGDEHRLVARLLGGRHDLDELMPGDRVSQDHAGSPYGFATSNTAR